MKIEPRLRRAAWHLVDAHAEREPFGAFPEDAKPRSIAEAYAVQDAFVALKSRVCGPVIGHKIALTTQAMRAMVGVADSIGGMLHEKQVVGMPASVHVADYCRLIVEFEIAVRLAADLPNGVLPHTRASVAAAVGALIPALEIADDRQADYGSLASHAVGLVADNAWSEGAVLGAAVSEWKHIDPAALRGTAMINGEFVGEGYGRDVMGHPFEALAWVANNLAKRGQYLRAGQIVITGSLITSKFPRAGDLIRFELDRLGSVELRVN